MAGDAQHQLLVAAELGLVLRQHLGAPALALAEAQVHARQVTGEQGALVAAGAGADLEEGVALVVGVFRQQGGLQLGLQARIARTRVFLAGLDAAIWDGDEGDAAARPRVVRSYPVDDPVAREELAVSLVELCNEALPKGGDPDATVRVVGESLVVQSTSRAFHVMAASIITAVRGVESIVVEEEESTGEQEAAAEVHAT